MNRIKVQIKFLPPINRWLILNEVNDFYQSNGTFTESVDTARSFQTMTEAISTAVLSNYEYTHIDRIMWSHDLRTEQLMVQVNGKHWKTHKNIPEQEINEILFKEYGVPRGDIYVVALAEDFKTTHKLIEGNICFVLDKDLKPVQAVVNRELTETRKLVFETEVLASAYVRKMLV